MALETSDRDGSLILTIRRDGDSATRTSWSTRPGEQELQTTAFDKPRPKNKRVTIHQSGRVNYHQNGSSIYIAPLTQTAQAFQIYSYRVPALDRLDMHGDEVAAEDSILDLSHVTEGPVFFSVLVGPTDLEPCPPAIKLGYEAEGYSVTVQADSVPFAVPAELDNHFITRTPDRGLFAQQQMAEDQAMVAYHQALAGTYDPIVYTPNGEGVIRMIFAVPMRIAPRFKIELADPELHVSDQDVQVDKRLEKVMLKFRIRRRKSGQVIRQAVEIRSITLDAEL